MTRSQRLQPLLKVKQQHQDEAAQQLGPGAQGLPRPAADDDADGAAPDPDAPADEAPTEDGAA